MLNSHVLVLCKDVKTQLRVVICVCASARDAVEVAVSKRDVILKENVLMFDALPQTC